MAEKLRGIFTPNMVPLDGGGQINEPELRRYVDWLIEHGVHGLYPNGSTGEFTRFIPEERRRIIQIVCNQAAGRVPILAGAAEANVNETLRACEAYLGFGARAVAIVSPFYYKLSPESVYAYFKEIATQSPIDVTLYNIPMFASPIDVETVKRLAEFPRVIGIKDSSGDMSFMLRMMATIEPLRPDFSFLTGWDAALMPMLLMGCDGGTNATSGVIPEVTRQMWDHCQQGRFDEARTVQLRLLDVFDAMIYSIDFPEGMRVAVEIRGFDMGSARQPLSESQKVNRPALQRVIQCMIADFGLADAPPEGCAPRTGDIDRDRVSQIAQDVIRKLREKGVV